MLLKTIKIENTIGIIDISGDDFDCAVYIKNKPVAINWCDNEGSIGQYLLNIGVDSSDIEHQLKPIRYYIQEGIVDNNTIDIIIEIFQSILAKGTYEIHQQYINNIVDIMNTSMITRGNIDQYYPFPPSFVALQNMNNLNKNKIVWYKKIIEEGKRPIIITLAIESEYVEFIIDGHHKAKAYQELKKPAQVITFKKLDAQKIVPNQGFELIKKYNTNVANKYAQNKT